MDRTSVAHISGCSSCKRRRIKCDRSEPSCHKCLKKGIKCPGYGHQLRWAGGAAIRGDLKDLQAQAEEQLRQRDSSRFDNVKALDASGLAEPSSQELVDYYSEHIAPRMVWFDSDDNIYRRHILPLAQKNKVIRLAVVAVATQHRACSRGDGNISEDTRNEAVSLITSYINDIRTRALDGRHADAGIDMDAAEWILASMLVLSCYEMAHSGAEAAEFHRKAARSLIGSLSNTPHRKSRLFTSMRNKLSVYDVLACTTSFDIQNIRDAVVPDPADEMTGWNETALFSGYLSLIHEVTIAGRQQTPAHRSSRDWKSEFEVVQGITLMAIGRSATNTPARCRDLIRLVNVHHNAALLYISRCLGGRGDGEAQSALSDLLRQIHTMEDLDHWLHNLPWPVFVAGTECCGNSERQRVISQLYKKISEVTGLRHYQDVLAFLVMFWSGNEPDWQILARDWELSGRRVLAY